MVQGPRPMSLSAIVGCILLKHCGTMQLRVMIKKTFYIGEIKYDIRDDTKMARFWKIFPRQCCQCIIMATYQERE